jgi:hypothetical protein
MVKSWTICASVGSANNINKKSCFNNKLSFRAIAPAILNEKTSKQLALLSDKEVN